MASNGSAKPTWPTTPFSKKVKGRIPAQCQHCILLTLSLRFPSTFTLPTFLSCLLDLSSYSSCRFQPPLVRPLPHLSPLYLRLSPPGSPHEYKKVISLTLSPIPNLIRNHKIPRLNLLLQAPHSTKSHQAPHTNTPQRRNIRPTIHLMRGNLMVQSVSREEGNGSTVVCANRDGRGGVAPWC